VLSWVVWDSRTIRWNASPVGTQTRFALYVAWTPREFMSEVELATKLEIFEQRKGTTGWAVRPLFRLVYYAEGAPG